MKRKGMNIIERCQLILLSPKTAWSELANSRDTPQEVLLQHVLPLAVVASLGAFIGYSLVGYDFQGVRVRESVLAGLLRLLGTVLLVLLACSVQAGIIRALAPLFGGRPSTRRAFMLAGYSGTPAWLAPVLQIIPALGFVGVLLSFYSVYLLYLGLPELMDIHEDDALKYTLAVFVASLFSVLLIVLLAPMLLRGVGLG